MSVIFFDERDLAAVLHACVPVPNHAGRHRAAMDRRARLAEQLAIISHANAAAYAARYGECTEPVSAAEILEQLRTYHPLHGHLQAAAHVVALLPYNCDDFYHDPAVIAAQADVATALLSAIAHPY